MRLLIRFCCLAGRDSCIRGDYGYTNGERFGATPPSPAADVVQKGQTLMRLPWRESRLLCCVGAVCWLAGLVGAEGVASTRPRGAALHRVAGNILKNSSFEQNWFNRKFAMRRRFLLLHGSDMGVGEQDGHIDHWRFRGVAAPECWETQVSRSGARSVRFDRAGSASQLVRFAGEQYWKAGGAFYSKFIPMAGRLAIQLNRRPIVVGAWCRTEGVPEGREPELVVSVQSAMRKNYESTAEISTGKCRASVPFSAGSHGWEYRQVKIVPKPLAPPNAEGPDVRDAGDDEALAMEAGDDITVEVRHPEYEGTPWWVTVQVVSKGGIVWFDDLSCVEPPDASQPNRITNGGFEAVGEDGWPAGWSRPVQWGWFRNRYYAFTGWSHWKQKQSRGSAELDWHLAFRGTHALRSRVLPGDSFAVHSAPIELNQDAARPIEARAMVKADNLRTLEIMAQDESGRWLPQGDFLGDDMEEPGHYNFGTTGSGTYDWSCVRKYFSPRKPVKSMRLFLCARGFDGAIVEKNLVGTVWFDEVQVFEHGASREPKPSRPEASSPDWPVRILDIDLGDRLWGRNVVKVLLEFREYQKTAERIEKTTLHLRLTSPSGKTTDSDRSVARILQKPTETDPKGYAVLSAAYRVKELCKSWKEQYELQVQVIPPMVGDVLPGPSFHFGTPSELISAGVSAYYLHPDESLTVYANLNVSRESFGEIDHCEVAITGGSDVKKAIRIDDPAVILKPQRSPDYVNARHLLQVKLDSEGFTMQPWREPVLDNTATIRLYGKAEGKPTLIAEGAPVRFGFMEKIPKPDLPETITKTAVNERGFITINGKPYFPVYWTPHFGILPEANYPPTRFGYKAVNLMSIVCPKEEASDEAVKAALLKQIEDVKGDPKLFQYELGDGEMQLQGRGWQQRLQQCRRAIEWIREADPDHLINGPVSWLIGHPRHNATMKHFVPHWDVIGVEASFEHQPKVNEFAKPFMRERKTAVLVGLETYFYQSNRTLRWRGYRSLLNGATGIGLCPSGMMQSRPDKVNYLRGLNGEFRGLAPLITAPEPAAKLSVSSPAVETMERVYDGKRYVIAVSDAGVGEGGVSFRFPADEKYATVKVLFEGRVVKPADTGFVDHFAKPRTVHVYELR